MLFDKLKNLNQSKPGLFSPSITRLIQEPSAASINFQVTAGEAISITDIESTSSFKYALPGKGMKSTQQLNVDWSKFQNHTFFNSAQVKTNVAFDKIINQYPFDGTLKENESYFDSLKHIPVSSKHSRRAHSYTVSLPLIWPFGKDHLFLLLPFTRRILFCLLIIITPAIFLLRGL